MLFNLVTLFIAATAASSASLPMKRDDATSATCTFLLQPSTVVDATENVAGEFNYAIGYALSTAVQDNIFQDGSTYTVNADGTFTVVDQVSATGKSAVEVTDIINSWVGTALQGFLADWQVESVSCTI